MDKENDFYKTGKIEDYLSMKEKSFTEEKESYGGTDKSERDNNTSDKLFGL